MPACALPLLALVLWIPVTAVQLPDVHSVGVFVYRWLIWVSALTGMLWLCNTSTLKLATATVHYSFVEDPAGTKTELVQR